MFNNFSNVTFQGSRIIIDGKEFDIKEYSENQEIIKVEIFGSVQSVKCGNGNLNLKAKNIGTVKNINGNIHIQANEIGSTSTANGNIYSDKNK